MQPKGRMAALRHDWDLITKKAGADFAFCGTIYLPCCLLADAGKTALQKYLKFPGFVVNIPVAPQKMHEKKGFRCAVTDACIRSFRVPSVGEGTRNP